MGRGKHPRGWVPLQERRKVCTGTFQPGGESGSLSGHPSIQLENAVTRYLSAERWYRPK